MTLVEVESYNKLLAVKGVLVSVGIGMAFLSSVILAEGFWDNRDNRLKKHFVHIPQGYLGAFILHNSMLHGLVYMFLIVCYQIMEMAEHLHFNTPDLGWMDIEGYTIGFIWGSVAVIFYNKIQITKNISEMSMPLLELKETNEDTL